VEAGTTRLDGLDLGFGPCHPLEALRKLGAVEKGTLPGLNGAKRGSWRRADVASREFGCLIQRAVLLRLLAVACERLRKRLRGRRRVDLGSVVDLYRRVSVGCANAISRGAKLTAGSGALAQEADHRLAALLEDLGSNHCDGVMRRCRSRRESGLGRGRGLR
jgi:hypothetical protein